MKRRILSLLLLLLLLCSFVTGCNDNGSAIGDVTDQAQSSSNESQGGEVIGYASVEGIPDYSGSPYVVLNDNVPEFTDEEIAQIIDIIKSYDYLDNLTFISFNYDNLLKVRRILPNQSAQYLFWKVTDEEIERLACDKIDVDVWCKELTREQIDACHRAGLTVNCWTVDEVVDGERLAEWGIDYITSNILE